MCQLIPQARSRRMLVLSPRQHMVLSMGCTGERWKRADASEPLSDAAREAGVALNWRPRLLGKGHDAGIRRRESEFGRHGGVTPESTCSPPPILSTPTPVLMRVVRLSRRCLGFRPGYREAILGLRLVDSGPSRKRPDCFRACRRLLANAMRCCFGRRFSSLVSFGQVSLATRVRRSPAPRIFSVERRSRELRPACRVDGHRTTCSPASHDPGNPARQGGVSFCADFVMW